MEVSLLIIPHVMFKRKEGEYESKPPPPDMFQRERHRRYLRTNVFPPLPSPQGYISSESVGFLKDQIRCDVEDL